MTGFVVMFLCGLLLGWFGRQAWRDAEQADRLEALRGHPHDRSWPWES
jgi:hypothetical protein